MPEFTSRQVADRFGVTVSRVHQLAKARGVVPQWFGQACVWSEADIKRMTPRPGPGSPRKDERRE